MFNFRKAIGDTSKKILKEVSPIVDKVNAFEESITVLSDDELKAKTLEFKERLEKDETLDDILPEAYAVVRETTKRVLNLSLIHI